MEYLVNNILSVLPKLMEPLAVARARRDGPRLLVDVRSPSGRRRRLLIETRVAGAPGRVLEVLRQLTTASVHRAGYPMVASAFLSSRARELCRQAGVGYVDLAGNCSLRLRDFCLEKTVERNPFPRRGRPPSLFSPVSSRILRVVLAAPARLWQVSELARAAGVSLGQSSNVCRRLIDEAYAERFQRRVRLTQPGALLDAWREADSRREPAAQAYYSFEQDPERLMARVSTVAAEKGLRYAVTSLAAASLVAPFVRGIGAVQWYIGEDASPHEWVGAMDLRPAEAGPNALLLAPHDPGVFVGTQTVNGITLVGNIQLYLDLWRSAGRGREQAEFLRQERITF